MTEKELQDVLGERINAMLNLDDLTEDEQRFEFQRSDMISRLAKQMINNADVILRTDKLIAEGKLMSDSIISKVIGYGE